MNGNTSWKCPNTTKFGALEQHNPEPTTHMHQQHNLSYALIMDNFFPDFLHTCINPYIQPYTQLIEASPSSKSLDKPVDVHDYGKPILKGCLLISIANHRHNLCRSHQVQNHWTNHLSKICGKLILKGCLLVSIYNHIYNLYRPHQVRNHWTNPLSIIVAS
jgi:hypothetical protein